MHFFDKIVGELVTFIFASPYKSFRKVKFVQLAQKLFKEDALLCLPNIIPLAGRYEALADES